MTMAYIASIVVHIVVYVATLFLALGWPPGRGKRLLLTAVALWTAATVTSAAMMAGVMTSPQALTGTAYLVVSFASRTFSLAGIAVFLAFVIGMRHDLNDLRYRAEDAETRAALHDAPDAHPD